jgi:hypothetical protein
MDSEAMARIEARLERVEASLERMSNVLDQIEPNLAMAADIADEWVAQRVGGDAVESRLSAVEDAVLRLTEPDTLSALVRIAEQASKLERVTGLAASFDDHVAMAADIADEWVEQTIGGDGLEERAKHGLETLVRLSDPRILSALGRLAEQAPKLERVVDLAASFDDHVAMAADIVDAFIRDSVGGDGLETRMEALRGTAVQLSRPEVLDALTSLASLAPKLQRSARVAADLDAFVDETVKALELSPKPVGAFGLLGALGDPEIQRGLGRVLNATRVLGRTESLLPVAVDAK